MTDRTAPVAPGASLRRASTVTHPAPPARVAVAAATLLLGLLALLALAVPAHAADGFTPPAAPTEGSAVVDTTGTLTDADKQEITKAAANTTPEAGRVMALMVKTTGTTTVADAAKDTAAAWGLDENGILILIAQSDHHWYITIPSQGFVASALTDSAAEGIAKAHLVSQAHDGHWSAALTGTATSLRSALSSQQDKQETSATALGSDILVLFGVALIAVGLLSAVDQIRPVTSSGKARWEARHPGEFASTPTSRTSSSGNSYLYSSAAASSFTDCGGSGGGGVGGSF